MNTPTPRTDAAAYSMERSGEHRDIERWCDLLNESRKLEKELTTITEQRDRLANALDNLVNANQKWNETMMGIIGRPPNWNDSYLNEAKEALQSLNQDHFPDVGNMIATTTTEP